MIKRFESAMSAVSDHFMHAMFYGVILIIIPTITVNFYVNLYHALSGPQETHERTL